MIGAHAKSMPVSKALLVARKAMPMIIVALIGGAILAYRYLTTPSPPTLACAFTGRAGPMPPGVPPDRRVPGDFRVQGILDNTTQDGLLSFRGTTIWAQSEARAGEGAVDGFVFLADDGAVQGLVLSVRHADFGRDDLQILTLNRSGILDYDRSGAFLYFDARGKLSRPVNYVCTIDRP
ncbi:MAG TPA: hypothetical protein VEX35_15085 [Allosphingosinicella sp.]|nr:hypothetical protein [Allosphingosinicella sp.]